MDPFVRQHLHDDVNELALQYAKYPGVDIRGAIVQIRGWQIAERKLPLWSQTDGILFPEHISLEQCSSQTTAEYKAEVIGSVVGNKDTMTDLTGGYGVDAAMIGRQFDRLTFVEPNSELCVLAQNNLPLLGIRNLSVVNSTCEVVLDSLEKHDLIYIDPSRRDRNGRKTFAVEDCTPDIRLLQDLLLSKGRWVMVKLSPMLDLSSVVSSLRSVHEIHVVSVAGECKEILVLMSSEATVSSPRIVCVNLVGKDTRQCFSFNSEDEKTAVCRYTSRIDRYLYEPNASIMKAMCFKSVASVFNVHKLHPNSHLYTSDSMVDGFPGRSFEVVRTMPMDKRTFKELRTYGQANLSIRNFPSTVAELRVKTRLKDGGDLYVFVTTLADNSKVCIVCRKIR